MSANAHARTQCKLKFPASAQTETQNRHDDIPHSDWNDRCWEGATHHVITCTLLFPIYSPKLYIKCILNTDTWAVQLHTAGADSMALNKSCKRMHIITCDVLFCLKPQLSLFYSLVTQVVYVQVIYSL